MNEETLEPFMLAERNQRLIDAIAQRTRNLVMVLDGVHDPHNLSATIRTCDAFGLLQMHVIETQARFRISHKVCQGAHKWVDVERWAEPEPCAQALKAEGYELWVADVQPGSVQVDDLPWNSRIALVLGNEHRGVSETMRRQATGCFHIPMYGFSESFNVSVAVGISLALAVRGRHKALGQHGDLSQAEQAQLLQEWQKRSVKASDLILKRLERKESGGEG